MGLFDHLFKSKSPPPEDKPAETGSKVAEPARRSGDAAPRSQPPHRADPSPFLHPKSYVPRGAPTLNPKAAVPAGAPSGARKPGSTPLPAEITEIVITLGDVLSRIPTHYLKAGQHDPRREMRFSIHDLSSDIARGRAAVPLSRIAALLPDIFVKEIGRDEDTEIRLPLQKLVDQIGLLRRPPAPSGERRPLPIPQGPSSVTLAPLASSAPGSTSEPAREHLHELHGPESAINLKPPESAHSAPANGADQVLELKPAPEPPAPPAAPSAAEAPPKSRLDDPAGPPVESVLREFENLVAASAIAAPAAAVSAEPGTPPPTAEADTPQSPEPVVTVAPLPPPPRDVTAADPADNDTSGEKIQLGLAAILRGCPREILIGELPFVSDSVRITLPFAPIDRQLVKGRVEVSAARFVAAMPIAYRHHFRAGAGVKVPIPLEEIFQNLPSPSDPPLPEPEPEGMVLAPASEGEAVTAPFETLPPPPQPAPSPVAVEAEREAPPAEPTPVEAPQEPAPQEPVPHLDLPAFHHFVPPPPLIVPAEEALDTEAAPRHEAAPASTPAEETSGEMFPTDTDGDAEPPETVSAKALGEESEIEEWSPAAARSEAPSNAPGEGPRPPPEDATAMAEAKSPRNAAPQGDEPPATESAGPLPASAADAPPTERPETAPDEPAAFTAARAAEPQSAGAEEATHTIAPPPMMRPPLVLPPLVFAPATERDSASVTNHLDLRGQEFPNEDTTNSENDPPVTCGAPEEEIRPPSLWPSAPANVPDEPAEGLMVVSMDEAKFIPTDGETAHPAAELPAAPAPPSAAATKPVEAPAAADPLIASDAGEPPNVSPPLLPLPRRIASVTPTEILPPPALPLTRFDQDALQAIFMTEEALDLPKISRLAAQLPGVHACVIATRDQACTGGQLPLGFDLAALLGLAPRVGEAAGRLPIGELKHFTLYGGEYSVSFFERNGLSLCAVHRPRSFVPGVREKLVAIADELAKA